MPERHTITEYMCSHSENRAECGQGLKIFAYILAKGFFTIFNWLLGTQFLVHCKN